jgi:hypothetical protein
VQQDMPPPLVPAIEYPPISCTCTYEHVNLCPVVVCSCNSCELGRARPNKMRCMLEPLKTPTMLFTTKLQISTRDRAPVQPGKLRAFSTLQHSGSPMLVSQEGAGPGLHLRHESRACSSYLVIESWLEPATRQRSRVSRGSVANCAASIQQS